MDDGRKLGPVPRPATAGRRLLPVTAMATATATATRTVLTSEPGA
ncbi:hypothetical protein [Streptomyces sp. NPDC002990]